MKPLFFATIVLAMTAVAASGGEVIAKAKIHSPLAAGWDAYARSEQARLQAIDRQRQANDLMTWYGTYAPGYYQAPPVPFRARGQRRYERRLSKSPYQLPFPAAPGYAYPSGGKVVPVLPYLNPNPAPIEQPTGHRKTWTSSNSYVYEPLYASDQTSDAGYGGTAISQDSAETIPVPVLVPAPLPSEAIPTPQALP